MTPTHKDGKMNMFAKETQPYVTEEDRTRHALQTHNEKAEIWNAKAAMIGFVLGIASYALTGNLFFGLY